MRIEKMGIVKDVEEMGLTKVLVYTMAILALIIPGMSFLYFFKLELFKELHILKLIIVALIYSTPLFFMNFLTAMISGRIEELKEEEDKEVEVKEKEKESKTVDKEKADNIMTVALYIASLYTFLALAFGLILGGYAFRSYVEAVAYTYVFSIGIFVIESWELKKIRHSQKL